MAITLEGTPKGGANLSPTYNPLIWYYSSDNVTEEGFRFVINIQDVNNLGEAIAVLEIPPRPSDGFGVIDIGKLLSDYVTSQLPDDTAHIEAVDCYIEYIFYIKERYALSYTWDAAVEASTVDGLAPDEFDDYVALEYSDTISFEVGDQIINQNTTPGLQPLLDGLLTVIHVGTGGLSDTIVVNRLWSTLQAGSTGDGESIYADGRKFTSAVLDNTGFKTAFNGAMSHVDFTTYDEDQFKLLSTELGDWLTSMPKTGFRVTEESVISLNAWTGSNSFARRVIISNGTTVKYFDMPSGQEITFIPIGPGNIDEAAYTLLSGPDEPVTSSPSESYSFYIASVLGGETPQSATYMFNLDYTCTDWDRLQIVFLDRLGSLGSFPFYYLNEESQTITRKQNSFQVGDVNTTTDEWANNSTDASVQNIDINIKTNLKLNTAWLSNAEAEYIQEMFSSPRAWINVGEAFYPVNILNTNSTTKDKRTTKNIRYDLNVSFANRETINW